jgi:hypothetical protein
LELGYSAVSRESRAVSSTLFSSSLFSRRPQIEYHSLLTENR